jgi:predicted transcriptional regulator YdeE
MQKTIVHLPEIKLVGIACRTSNARESHSETAQIGSLYQRYFADAVSEKIVNKNNPSVTYCVYTEYESDHTGDYTCLIGQEVSSFDSMPEGLSQITIPAQKHVKCTNGPGVMPALCINSWKDIWAMTSEQLGGEREYLADLEMYDERAYDPRNVVFDIFVGIR